MSKHSLIQQAQERTGTRDAGAVTVKNIPIGDIVVRKNVRESDDKDIEGLKATIRDQGLIQPITVYRDGDDYVVAMGHRRLRAFRELYTVEPDRFHSIRCIITDNKNITIRQLIENVQRVDLEQIELYHALKELKEQGLNHQQIAGVIGKAEGYVKHLFAGINEIDTDPENIEILQKLPGVTLKDFQTVKPIKDKSVKKKLLIAKAEKKITRDELQRKARTHNHKPDQSRSASMDLNADKLTIKITFKEKNTFHKIAGELKALLKRHNISTMSQEPSAKRGSRTQKTKKKEGA